MIEGLIGEVLEGNRVFSIISPVGGVISLALGIYVFKKNPFMRTTRTFFLIMGILTAASIFDFLLMNAPHEEFARWAGRLVLFSVTLVFAGFLYLASLLPYERQTMTLTGHIHLYCFVALISALVPAVAVDEMLQTSYGWGIPSSAAMTIFQVIIYVYVVMAVLLLVMGFRSSRSEVVKMQCALTAFAVTFPLIYSLVLQLLDVMGLFAPPVIAPGFLVSSFIFAYGVMRHDLFLISPAFEEGLHLPTQGDSLAAEVEGGSCLLIEGKDPEEAYGPFLEELSKGAHGLLISRTHPDQVRERYGLVKTPIIWLASQPGPDRLEPTNLSIMQHTIAEFLKRSPNAVVMIEGLEYLLSNNPVSKVLLMLYAMRDELTLSGAKAIIHIDPDVLEERDLALFERECQVIVRSSTKRAGTEI